MLDAAHIQPYSKCINQIEKYDINNGILMCRNHHRLFDAGYFTFTASKTIKISKELNQDDGYLLIKTFEPCYAKELNQLSMHNQASFKYIQYHQKHIFKEN